MGRYRRVWETLDGEDQHRVGNRRGRRTDDRQPNIREWEVETRGGRNCGVVRPDWNGVTQNQRTGERGERSQVDRVLKEMESGRVIRIATLNIRSGRVGVLETALRALRQGNIGMGVLQETELTGRIHMRLSSGYNVWATEAESQHRGGVAIVWRAEEAWGVDEEQSFGPNLVSFTVASVRCWGIHAPQQLTGGLSYDTSFNMWAGGGGEDANRRPQRLSGTSEVPKGGAPSDRHRKPWADRPGTALHAKTEVPSRRKLDVEIL